MINNDKPPLQPSRLIDAVFEGGGVKGIGLVGAIMVTEELGYGFEHVAGTSAGAIVASLLAAGYSGAELKDIILNLNYTQFEDTNLIGKIPVIGPLLNLIFGKGIFQGKVFEEWLREKLEAKGVRTFADLVMPQYQNNPLYRYRLRVIASDITDGVILELPQDIAKFGIDPDAFEVATAVRMSMSLPFFYKPIVALNRRKKRRKSYIIDGAILSNYPVWIFDGKHSDQSWPTFGYKLVAPGDGKPHQIGGPITLFKALFATIIEAHDARYIEEQSFDRTIPIPTLGVGTTEFTLSRERSLDLFKSGRRGARKFFATWDFEAYKKKYQ